MKLSWNKLITSKRYGIENNLKMDLDARTEFERDYDRIIFSTPFRRLKDKTQVFPVPKSDFVHNRLTHSIEVSCIGRSIGKIVGNFILKNETVVDSNDSSNIITASDFGYILSAACLAHDIGNPPFGHSGEEAFRIYYKKRFNLEQPFLRTSINDSQKNDLLFFEGNAEGFRILTNEHPSNVKGGLKLTLSTLSSFCKYPRESLVKDQNELGKKVEKRRSFKKFGFFQTEKEIYKEIADQLGLISLSDNYYYWCRHPLSFLVEAADNIAYTIMDLEDAHKLKLITHDEVKKLLIPIAENIPKDPCNTSQILSMGNKDEIIGAFRAKAINSLIFQTCDVFKNNYSAIMNGIFDSELTEHIIQKEEFKCISDKTKEFFKDNKVIQIESSGRFVVGGLLDIYLDAFLNMNEKYGENLITNLPIQFRVDQKMSDYEVLLRLSTYISRMTDNYAIDLYRKLSGINLPEIN